MTLSRETADGQANTSWFCYDPPTPQSAKLSKIAEERRLIAQALGEDTILH